MRYAFFALMVACGGQDSPVFDGSLPDAPPDTSPSGDAAADAPVPKDGGGLSNPGKVTCGSVECNSPAEVCCGTFSLGGDGGKSVACTTPNGCTGTAGACDEAADCPASNICCLEVGSTWSPITKCKASCGI